MKKIFALLLSFALACNASAAQNTSAPHKHHKKHHKHITTAKSATHTAINPATGDPILDAVAQKSNNNSVQAKKSNTKKIAQNVVSSPPATVTNGHPRLYSYSAYAIDANTKEVFVSKNPSIPLPIASITKLMTAMVLLDSGADLDQYIAISENDVDHLRNTFSRLKVGMQLRRRDLLLLALMSSENRAAAAIARTAYPGGISEFIRQMNIKAKSIGMTDTRFLDPTGLSAENKATAMDLTKMVQAAFKYDLIREDTTTKGADVILSSKYTHHYMNSDALVRNDNFQIELSKTGFINEAGHCLVLYAVVNQRPVVMAFLNSAGKSGRLVDATAVKNYVDKMQ